VDSERWSVGRQHPVRLVHRVKPRMQATTHGKLVLIARCAHLRKLLEKGGVT